MTSRRCVKTSKGSYFYNCHKKCIFSEDKPSALNTQKEKFVSFKPEIKIVIARIRLRVGQKIKFKKLLL